MVFEPAVVAAVMTEVGDDRPRSEVDIVRNHRISGVAQVTDADVFPQQAVLDFNRLADMAAVADRGVAANVAVRPDFTVFADDDVSFDVNAVQDDASFVARDETVDRLAVTAIPSIRLRSLHRRSFSLSARRSRMADAGRRFVHRISAARVAPGNLKLQYRHAVVRVADHRVPSP